VKYLVAVLNSKEMMFVFPRDVEHDRMWEALEAIRFGDDHNWRRELQTEGSLVSAGFIDLMGYCYGTSETLGIGSRGDVDTALFQTQIKVLE